MEIIFHGGHDSEEAEDSLASIIRLFKERYHIGKFREMHLSVTLVDDQGEDVELVDSETSEAFRVFEVYRSESELPKIQKRPIMKLVVDNAPKKH